jgi:hypothetical protein
MGTDFDMARIPTCVWRVSDLLIAAVDEHLGDPVDAYVNGSQTWLLENGPGGIMLEWRLHPVAGYQRPAGIETMEVFPTVAGALFEDKPPPVPVASLWDGLEVFPAYGDEIEPAPLRAAAIAALGIEPEACGLVDHEPIGDEWERSGGKVNIIDALLTQLAGPV